MAIEIKAPTFPESVADGTVATWHKKPGEAVKRDELIVDIETDKVVIEVLAEADGVLAEIIKNEGDTVLSNELHRQARTRRRVRRTAHEEAAENARTVRGLEQ
ncbi:biotin/lipoyl-containing protein, partial [Pseudomonas aeruginosa]